MSENLYPIRHCIFCKDHHEAEKDACAAVLWVARLEREVAKLQRDQKSNERVLGALERLAMDRMQKRLVEALDKRRLELAFHKRDMARKDGDTNPAPPVEWEKAACRLDGFDEARALVLAEFP